jgi:DNA-binding beta-propeller fold protein YncE
VGAGGPPLYVADGDVPPRTRLAILDATTGALDGAPVALPATPWDVVVTADGRTAYVTYAGGGVAVIDVAQRRVTRTFNTGTEGFHVALSADETRLYVGGRVTEITLATGVMRQFAASTGNAQDLVLSADGATLYTVVESAGTFVAFDVASGQPKWTTSVPNCGPWGLAVAPDETRAYATCGGSLAVVDLETHATLPNILAPGGRLRRLAFSPDGLTLYVASEGLQVFIVR